LQVRILTSIASAEWAFAAGEIVDESHAHFAAALALTHGPCAELVADPGKKRTETAALKRH
jgi:hypothetical protein